MNQAKGQESPPREPRATPALRWVWLLAIAPTLTEYLESGRGPSSARELITDAVLTVLLLGCAFQIRRQAKALAESADTDSLTGLFNRRKLDRDLRREVGRAQRIGDPLALAYIDVDGFKGINDREGHGIGDAVLASVAATLRSCLRRDVDTCYRVGGDEFVALLPGADPAAARQAMERVRGAVHAEPLALGRRGGSLSIGVALLQGGEEPDALLSRADGLMYAAKQSGKDRVFGAGPDREPGREVNDAGATSAGPRTS